MDNNYQDLASAVVERAAKDYIKALKRLNKSPNSISAKTEIKRLEAFFHSDYYKMLTRLDPDQLIGKLIQEV